MITPTKSHFEALNLAQAYCQVGWIEHYSLICYASEFGLLTLLVSQLEH